MVNFLNNLGHLVDILFDLDWSSFVKGPIPVGLCVFEPPVGPCLNRCCVTVISVLRLKTISTLRVPLFFPAATM